MWKKSKRAIRYLARRMAIPLDRLIHAPYDHFPFGDSPRAPAETYEALWQSAKAKRYPAIDEFESRMGYAVDEGWFHKLALQTQVVIKKSEICYPHGRLLYTLASDYIARSDAESINILETGTARGFSSLCMAKALHDANTSGKILTLDVLPHDVRMYWNCIADANGPLSRAELLSEYQPLLDEHIVFIQGDSKLQLRKIHIPRIHIAFLDGSHSYDDVRTEFQMIQSKQKDGDIIFFDDYTPEHYPGIVKAVDEICETENYTKEVIRLNEQRGYAIARKRSHSGGS